MGTADTPAATLPEMLLRTVILALLWWIIAQGQAGAWLIGLPAVTLAAVASLTGRRAEAYRGEAPETMQGFASFTEPDSIAGLLQSAVVVGVEGRVLGAAAHDALEQVAHHEAHARDDRAFRGRTQPRHPVPRAIFLPSATAFEPGGPAASSTRSPRRPDRSFDRRRPFRLRPGA